VISGGAAANATGEAIWDELRKKGTSRQVANVEELVEYAAGMLDRVQDSFPTYTLHNHVHSENVLGNMERLLGENVSELSALEASMLVLAAYFHDIGMVYLPEELSSLTGEPAYEQFLRDHPKLFMLETTNHGSATEVIEAYCRSRHAHRVGVILDHLDKDDLLMWGSISIRRELELVCQSHGSDASTLTGTDFAVDFLDGCDLRMCSILLRLGDILDFDNSRSPEGVYGYLGLADRRTPRQKNSDVEWLKHLQADGFIFPQSRTPGYELKFLAGPRHPAVEHDVRQFLDVIEAEFDGCQRMIELCSPRWRDLPLPGKIDRDNVISQGYTYGDFRLVLDRDAILKLFMGENLYSDKSSFVRELLQNSIDATRARRYLQGGQIASDDLPLRIDHWIDAEGSEWFAISDCGTGMTLSTIKNYLFRIGKSYYSSADFLAEAKRAHRGGEVVVSIGRFGVGLLSCFLVGDRIELSTRHVSAQGELGPPIRVSVPGPSDFFVVQTRDGKQQDRAEPMPSPPWGEQHKSGYLTSAGTVLAVRMKSDEIDLLDDVSGLCSRFVSHCEFPVLVNNVPLIEPVIPSLESAIEPGPIAWLPPGAQPSDGLRKYLQAIEISAREIDVESAGVPGVKGRLWVIEVEKPSAQDYPLDLTDWLSANPNVDLTQFNDDRSLSELHEPIVPRIYLQSYRKTPSANIHLLPSRLRSSSAQAIPGITLHHNISTPVLDPSPPSPVYKAPGRVPEPHEKGPRGAAVSWSHNGIRLPKRYRSSPETDEVVVEWTGSDGRLVAGYLNLSNAVRPVLNIAREVVIGADFDTVASIRLAIRRCQLHIGVDLDALHNAGRYNFLDALYKMTLADVASSPLCTESGFWRDEALFKLTDPKREEGASERFLTLEGLIHRVNREGKLHVTTASEPFAGTLGLGLLILEADVVPVWNKSETYQRFAAALTSTYQVSARTERSVTRAETMGFRPGTFLSLNDPDVLKIGATLNVHHPLVTWLIDQTAQAGGRNNHFLMRFVDTARFWGNQHDSWARMWELVDKFGGVPGVTPYPGPRSGEARNDGLWLLRPS
jgi:hypothetical protein